MEGLSEIFRHFGAAVNIVKTEQMYPVRVPVHQSVSPPFVKVELSLCDERKSSFAEMEFNNK